MALYRGRIVQAGDRGKYGFIGFKSIVRADGSVDHDLEEIRKDMFFHVNENPELIVRNNRFNNSLEGIWIQFEIEFKCQRRDGDHLVYNGRKI